MRKTTWAKVGILLVGVILVAYSAYIRSIGPSKEYLLTAIGIILIIIGVIGFFFGEGEEKEIEPEETKEEETEHGKI